MSARWKCVHDKLIRSRCLSALRSTSVPGFQSDRHSTFRQTASRRDQFRLVAVKRLVYACLYYDVPLQKVYWNHFIAAQFLAKAFAPRYTAPNTSPAAARLVALRALIHTFRCAFHAIGPASAESQYRKSHQTKHIGVQNPYKSSAPQGWLQLSAASQHHVTTSVRITSANLVPFSQVSPTSGHGKIAWHNRAFHSSVSGVRMAGHK